MQPLFFEPTVEFAKTAAQTQLPEDPNAWPTEVLQELYKQAPYIADFSPHVVMEKVDGEQGYGLGHVEVGNQTEIQTATSPEMSQAAGVRQVRVPVIIKDGMLQPFDLLVMDNSKVLPLTETRLRAAIFRPQAFDVTSRTPGDQSMIGQLYPPYRQNQGFGGGGTMANVGMGKEGSALEHYLTEKSAFSVMTDEEKNDPDFRGPQPGDFELVNGKRVPMKFHNHPSANKKAPWKPATWHKGEVVRDKTAGAFQDFGNQFLSADYLHAGVGTKQARAGKRMVEGEHRPGMLDEFISKTASVRRPQGQMRKTGSILEAILPTINESDLNAFKRTISDPGLQPLLFKNAAAITPAFQLLLEAPREKRASLESIIHPTVVQLKRVDDGYRVKAASHHYWAPVVQTIDRGEAIARFGEKVVLAADLSGAMTMADDASAMETPEEMAGVDDADLAGAEPVTEPGVYKVKTPEGEVVVGYVIPNLVDIDGTAIPLSLFTNGSVATVQTDIVGCPAEGMGEQLELPTADVPRGRGVFATADGPMGPQATVPLTIDATLAGIGANEPMSFRAESFSGEQVLVSRQPNIQEVTSSDGKMLVPEGWTWVPLDKAEEVSVESQEDGLKMASLARDQESVQLVSGGSTFSFRGHRVEKLAHDEREMLGIDDTMFLLAGLGVDQNYGVRKMAEAMNGLAPVRVRVGREIKLASDERFAATERARAILDSFPVAKQQLFKEAAALGDPTAVDTVLSLGFLNPENLNTFIGYLPLLEDAQSKMCDVLLASRLGNLIDTPEGAIERAVRSTEAVLEGLKALAFQNN